MPAKQTSEKTKTKRVFGQRRTRPKMFRVGLYARVSTSDQHTIPLQVRALREYAAQRGWTIAMQVKEVGSGAVQRELREKLLDAARRREIDVVLVWRLDRWGPVGGGPARDTSGTGPSRSRFRIADRSTRSDHARRAAHGRITGGLRRVEREILRERVRAGLAEARLNGTRLGRPQTAALQTGQVRKLYRAGVSKAEIARRLRIGRTSVRRILA